MEVIPAQARSLKVLQEPLCGLLVWDFSQARYSSLMLMLAVHCRSSKPHSKLKMM